MEGLFASDKDRADATAARSRSRRIFGFTIVAILCLVAVFIAIGYVFGAKVVDTILLLTLLVGGVTLKVGRPFIIRWMRSW